MRVYLILPIVLAMTALGLVGVACQSRAGDCSLNLTCPDSGGASGDGGSSTSGGSTGTGGAEGGQGGSGADGGTGSGGTPPACDPREEDCTDQVAFHVSPLGDDSANGAKETPLKTVSYALARMGDRAADGFGVAAIYVCATEGAYEETLSIGPEHNGVGLFGGFDCDSFEPIDERTEIIATTPAGHRIEGAEGITLGDLLLRSPDATEPSESSFGLWVVESDDVKVVRSEVEAGAGAPGAAGEGYAEQAEKGADGKAGNNACSPAPNAGGSEVVTTCGDLVSVGGQGGLGAGGIVTDPGNGAPGQPDGGTTGTFEPGAAGLGEGLSLCTPGQSGAPGTVGEHGQVFSVLGTLSGSGYEPVKGGDGAVGTNGKGGGGGGGAAKPADLACPSGASGGSGGGGGCLGASAKGGNGGGGSFGVLSLSSTLVLESVAIVAIEGGLGGAGGDGQAGGAGGSGGPRGTAGTSDGNDACQGGNGGKGGNGGSGAGGPGGPSIGIAHVGSAPTLTEIDFDLPSEGAPGGAGGARHVSTGQAPAGIVEEVRAF